MRRRVAITFVLAATVCVLVGRGGCRGRALQALRPGSPLLCARITVPLDRSGAVPGTLKLHVERLRSRGPREGALMALAGGPGRGCDARTSSTGPSASGRRSGTATWWCSTSAARVSRRAALPEPVRAGHPHAAGAGAGRRAVRRSRSGHAAPSTRPGTRSTTSMPCGAPSAWTRSPCSASRTGRRSRSGTPPSIRSTSSGWCSTRSSSRPAQAPFSQESLAAVPRMLRSLCCARLRAGHRRTCRQISRLVLTSMRGGLLYGPLVAADGTTQARADRPAAAAWSCCSPATSTPRCAPSCRLRCGRRARATRRRCCGSPCEANGARARRPPAT